jgi:hypothetical protein
MLGSLAALSSLSILVATAPPLLGIKGSLSTCSTFQWDFAVALQEGLLTNYRRRETPHTSEQDHKTHWTAVVINDSGTVTDKVHFEA